MILGTMPCLPLHLQKTPANKRTSPTSIVPANAKKLEIEADQDAGRNFSK